MCVIPLASTSPLTITRRNCSYYSSPQAMLTRQETQTTRLTPRHGRSAQKPTGKPLSRPLRPFWCPMAAIFDFASSAALQKMQLLLSILQHNTTSTSTLVGFDTKITLQTTLPPTRTQRKPSGASDEQLLTTTTECC